MCIFFVIDFFCLESVNQIICILLSLNSCLSVKNKTNYSYVLKNFKQKKHLKRNKNMFVLNSVMSCIRSKKICKLNKLLNKSDTSRLVGYFRPCFSHSDCHSDLNQQIQQLQIESLIIKSFNYLCFQQHHYQWTWMKFFFSVLLKTAKVSLDFPFVSFYRPSV